MYATIHPIEPFDATVGTKINFTWQGNQIYKVRCIIKNNASGNTVYDQTIHTMKQIYTIPADSGLENGTYYIAYITVLDIDNHESSLQSTGTPFYCFSNPTFQLSIKQNAIIKTSAYQVGLTYSQQQEEPLDSYCITLYTYQKTELQTSGSMYDAKDLSYLLSGLENAKQYYIRATGKTLHNMPMDTGYILFTVSYTTAQIFNPLELNNKKEYGAIEIKSNIVSTLGIAGKDVVYIDEDYADLRNNNVTFATGFEVNGDFTKAFIFNKPNRNKKIIQLKNSEENIVNIYYREGTLSDSNGEKAFFELSASSCGTNYILFSNYVPIPTDTQQFLLCINRIGHYYDMNAKLTNKM